MRGWARSRGAFSATAWSNRPGCSAPTPPLTRPRSARALRLKRAALALLLIGAASPDPATLLRAQRSAEAEAARLAQTAQAATSSAAKVRALSGELDARIAASRAAVAVSRAKLDALDARRRTMETALNEQRQPLARLVAALVALQRRPAALALIQPASLDTQAHARAALSGLVPAIEARTAALRGQMAALDRLRAAADAERLVVDRAGRQLVAQQAALSRYAAGRLRAAETATGQGLAAQDRALTLADDAARLQRALDEAKADAVIAGRLALVPRMLAQPGAPVGKPAYRLPAGSVVTGYGERLDDGRSSAALILAPAPGAAIPAPRGGTIGFAGPVKGYGQVVIVEHGSGWTSVVAGLASTTASRGDRVETGASLGRAPAANPAIRLELRHHGKPVPPTRLAG